MCDARSEPAFVPYFGYRDAAAALSFLTTAFGFTETARYPGDDGRVLHAEMSYGGGRLMLGSVDHGEDHVPSLRGQSVDHGTYVVVDDVERHHERAVASGARIVYPPEDTGFGTRRYRALDPEGYEWSFGTYRPA